MSPYHQLSYQETKHPNQRIPLRDLFGPEMSAQTLVCQTARSGPLGRDIFLGTRGDLPLVLAARPQATRLGKSGRLLLAGPLCPGPLGPATATDDRHRQARTLVHWTARSRSCCVALVSFPLCRPYSPQNLVCLTFSHRSLLGVLLATRALARLTARSACRYCGRSSARPLGRCHSASVRRVC